jgi:carboxyl-terminal processing protease
MVSAKKYLQHISIRSGGVKGWHVINMLMLGLLGWQAPLQANINTPINSQTVLFNNFPRVALLVKEQYVDPKRIKPDAMLASILESLESRIAKLVVSLPKSLERALELSRATEEKHQPTVPEPPADPKKAVEKEKLVLDIGGTKKSFDYEPQRSLWGMIFFLRDVFRFVEAEAKKQGLTKASKDGEEPIDWEKSESGVINAMLATLDPHSVYLEPKYARDLTLTTKGEFGGIGIVISVRDGFLTVISPIDETPAAKAGVKAKDRIVKIDDDSAINMDLNDAVNLLRGKPHTTVRITVQRANSAKDFEFTLKRDVIKVDSVAYALLDNEMGYLRIKAFQGNTAIDVKEGILAMKKKSKGQMGGLVLDLRGNPGGLLREAVEVSSLFLDGGEVVSTQGPRADSRQVEMASPGELDSKLKIVVLADGGSASASEIVASALKSGGPREGRAIVVGERTFGKGSVQMLFDFPSANAVEPAALKLTIAEYFGPNNKSMQNIGVDPDIALAPVQASKLESLRLFPEIGMREEDLLGHLSPDRPKPLEEKSLVNIEFLAPPPDEEGLEYGKVDAAKLKQDFAVKVASEVIKAAHGQLRTDLLKSAQEIKSPIQAAEYKKIIENLKKYNIDWSQGETQAKNGLKATITENKGASSGNKMKVSVKVKNTTDQPFFQVHGITRSKTPLFDQKEFLFGKLLPGKEIEREVVFDIPKDVVSRKDLLNIELRDYRREKLSELDIPLTIKGLGRPRFAHMVYVDDTKAGNGDGQLQKGEEVELTIWIKNIGDGKAFEPTILLRNESGSKVFLKNGRFQSGELLPNQEVATTFSFRVKEPTDKVDFEIQVFDGQMHDIWRDKISFDVTSKRALKANNKALVLKSREAGLFEKPDGRKKIAMLKEGIRLQSVKEVDGYLLVKVDNNLSGFIKKSDIKEAPKAGKEPAKKVSDFYAINYDRVPPHIYLQFGNASGWSRDDAGKVVAEITDAERLTGLMLYVNGKKVLYKDLKKAGAKEKLEHLVTLKPGVNSISLFAKETSTYGQKENITVFYDNEGRAVRSLEKPVIKAQTP